MDVYSFGLTLVAMVVKEHILDFVGGRYQAFTKKKARQPMRYIRAMYASV